MTGIRVGRQASSESRWLQPPRLRTLSEEGERHASWLELFFDLVFVVAITELSSQLVIDHSAGGFLRFAALFIPVFVAWQGYMAYATRFDTDDLAFRVAYFAAMLSIAAMAVLIHDVARGKHSAGFAVAYVILRSIMLALYGRAWRTVPEARPLIRFYGGGYALGAAFWLVSLAFETPWRYGVWVAAQVLELSLPPLSTRLHRRIPTSASHLPERWALFTLIVLGESVVAVAIAISDASWNLSSAATRGARVRLGRRRLVALLRPAGGRRPARLHDVGRRLLVRPHPSPDRARRDERWTAPRHRARERRSPRDRLEHCLHRRCHALRALADRTRTVTVSGPRKLGVWLKLGAVAVMIVLVLLQSVLPPVALAGVLAGLLTGLVFAERTVIPLWQGG